MRYIGSKKDLLGFIEKPLIDNNVLGTRICDMFSGSIAVAKHFKQKGYEVTSNDNMLYSYVFQQAYIKNDNHRLGFFGLRDIISDTSLPKVISLLNSLEGKKGFMFDNFCKVGTQKQKYHRNYLTDSNAMKIDVIRDKLEEWKEESRLLEHEYYILLSALIEAIPFVSNVAGIYATYLKINDPRMFKKLTLETPQLLSNGRKNKCYNKDANSLVRDIDTDILYIDPPYNHRQYASNYHLWETVAVWDKKIRDTQTGLREWSHQRSDYCSKVKCENTFSDLISHASADYIMVSYSSEGIMPLAVITDILESVGSVTRNTKKYRRFKSNSRNNKDNHVAEYLFFVKVNR